MSENLLSVIIPIYNAERFLDECLKSVIEQEYKNIELILINDGSADSSLKICEKYKAKDFRIKLINQENGGQSKATKVGVELSTGDYIAFVDSDDSVSKTLFKDVMAYLNNDSALDMVCFNYKRSEKDDNIYASNNIVTGYYDSVRIENEIIPFMMRNRDLNGQRGLPTGKYTKIYKSKIIKKLYEIIPLEVALGEDLISSALAISLANNLFIAPSEINGYYYRLNTDSVCWRYKKDLYSRSIILCNALKAINRCAKSKDYLLDVEYEICFFAVHSFLNEYFFSVHRTKEDKISVMNEIINSNEFKQAIKIIDFGTIKFYNKIILKKLCTLNVKKINRFGSILNFFKKPILVITKKVISQF